MAKFVYDEKGDYPIVLLDAAQGEEVPVEMVAAWAALKQAYALNQIADNIIGLDNAITAAGRAISDT